MGNCSPTKSKEQSMTSGQSPLPAQAAPAAGSCGSPLTSTAASSPSQLGPVQFKLQNHEERANGCYHATYQVHNEKCIYVNADDRHMVWQYNGGAGLIAGWDLMCRVAVTGPAKLGFGASKSLAFISKDDFIRRLSGESVPVNTWGCHPNAIIRYWSSSHHYHHDTAGSP